jgi:hypothetical protein
MSTYSTLFFSGTVGSGTTTLYTVGPLNTVIIRDLELYAGVPSDIQFAVALGAPGLTSYLWFVNPLKAGEWAQWQGRTVLPPGHTLLAVSGAAGVVVTASGYLLVNYSFSRPAGPLPLLKRSREGRLCSLELPLGRPFTTYPILGRSHPRPGGRSRSH